MIKSDWKAVPSAVVVATKALAYIAAQPGVSKCIHTAAVVGCSASYLENIFKELRAAGLVLGQRGPRGGYRLARPAESILLGEVITALIDGGSQRLPAGLAAVRDEYEKALRATTLQTVMAARA